MASRIQISDTIAEISLQKWIVVSGDNRWAEILNDDIPVSGPSPSDPDPDLTQAENAVKNYGAKMLSSKSDTYGDSKTVF